MVNPKIIWLMASLCLISACEPIRLPSLDKAAIDPIPSETVSETETVETASIEPHSTPAETETDEIAESAAEPAAPPLLESQPAPEVSVTDLAALNATLCGQSAHLSDDSPTLAERAGAQPSDPDLISTATVNGASARLSDFPGLVKMEPREFRPSGAIASGHCGATRIAEDWFLTAAHCLDDDYDEVRLIVGAESLTSPWAKRIEARASICHAGYGGASGSYVNDIALVRVNSADQADLETVPITAYGSTDEPLAPFHYAQTEMAGWGLTAFNGQLSDTLLSAELKLVRSGPAALYVYSQNGAGPCIGDSGGPLFITETSGQKRLVGVLSVVEQNSETGGFCQGDYGARYTNVQGYQNWIQSVIQQCEQTPQLCGL